MLRRSAVLVLFLGANLLSGCAARQAQVAGGTIAVLGVATTIVGIGVAAGCEPFPDNQETTCETDDWEPAPVPGLQTAGVGLFLIGLGALIAAVGTEDSDASSSSKSRVTPVESWTPTPPLDPLEPTESSELPERSDEVEP